MSGRLAIPGSFVRCIQENGGHGMAVMAGLRGAQGVYYKVVDSDDWLDGQALSAMLSILRGFIERDLRVDLFISNYVYEKVHEGTHNTVSYRMALPRKKIFGWDEMGRFRPDQNLLMHSLCYRTDVLRDEGLPMPAHTFYVDNIYAYVPLPRCRAPCTTPISTCIATSLVARARASTRPPWSSAWTSSSA